MDIEGLLLFCQIKVPYAGIMRLVVNVSNVVAQNEPRVD